MYIKTTRTQSVLQNKADLSVFLSVFLSIFFVCTPLLCTKVSASKVHSFTSTDWVWAPVRGGEQWEEEEETCSGFASSRDPRRLSHHSLCRLRHALCLLLLLCFVFVHFCSGEGKVSVHCFSSTWNSPSKVPSDTSSPRESPWFRAGVTVS